MDHMGQRRRHDVWSRGFAGALTHLSQFPIPAESAGFRSIRTPDVSSRPSHVAEGRKRASSRPERDTAGSLGSSIRLLFHGLPV